MPEAIRRRLFEPVAPLWRYCLLAVPVAITPSILLYGGAEAMLRMVGIDPSRFAPPDVHADAWGYLGAVVFAPVTETYILAWFLALMSSASVRPLVAACASALIWGSVHASFGALWFFGTVWSFFVLSCAYIAWRKVSFKHAYAAAALPHALVNLCVMLGATWLP